MGTTELPEIRAMKDKAVPPSVYIGRCFSKKDRKMDKTSRYRSILEEFLRTRAAAGIATEPGAEPHLIIDPEKDEYVLMWIGWSGYKYMHGIMFHLQIIDGKVWIHEDRTDIDIAGRLVERGIPKSDIVLGYVSPEVRESGGYAVA